MQRLSIIVPLRGNLKQFEDTLVSVLENQPEQSEVVVVLNEPYDDPYELRSEVKFVDAPRGASLMDCFASGLAASSAPLVHTIAAGIEATPGWADAAMARFMEADIAAVAPLVVDRGDCDRVLSAGLSYTSAGSIGRIGKGQALNRFVADDRALCGPELAVAFYRRRALETMANLHHYCADVASAVDLALALRQAGYRLVQEPTCVTTAGSEAVAADGAWREGVGGERLFLRWRAVPGWRRSAAAHALLLATEFLQAPLRPSRVALLAGRACARLGLGSPRAVAIGSANASSQQAAVIRPPHFSAVEARPALPSRAAG